MINIKLETYQIVINDKHLLPSQIPKLRGYIGNKFSENIELHNHFGNKLIYKYPQVQYKIVNNTPMIIGIGDNVKNVMKKLYIELKEVKLDNIKFQINEKSIIMSIQEFGISENMIHYKFYSPWIALNQNNYSQYIKSSDEEQKNMLKKILIGNIISMSKSLNYTVPSQINVLLNVKESKIVKYKSEKMLGFKADFFVNFYLPNYLALGKGVSRGYGTIEKSLEQYI